MAINCIAFFNNPSTTITTLQSGVGYSGTIANQFTGAFFKFEMIEFETVFFDLFIQPNTSNGINVAFTLYRKVGTSYVNLGTSISDEFNNSFEYSASPGEYYICITTDFSVNYTLSAEFTDFPFVSIADADAYGGAYMPPFEFAKPTSFCDSAVFYEIIEGELPKGLSLQSDGVISGIPEEQDCDGENIEREPSFTWWEDDESGTRKATGSNHRVVIRAALVDARETFADREFFICVHNNWDYDRDAFIESIPNFETPVFEVKGEESWNEVAAEPPLPEQPLTDIETDTPLCEPCPTEPPKSLTLEEIKELTKQVYIAPEYQGLVTINDEGLCEVCPAVEEPDPLALETFDVDLCDICPEPVVFTTLQEIPASMCPSCIESTELETPEDKYVPGIPELCYPELLSKMFSSKVCISHHTCGPTGAIYKESKKLSGSLLPKTMCDPECE